MSLNLETHKDDNDHHHQHHHHQQKQYQEEEQLNHQRIPNAPPIKYVSAKTGLFCNNCGKTGHAYNTCKSPITSIGLIVFRYAETGEGIQYLMIRRRDSFGFVDFVRGKYPVQNEEYVKRIIDEMTLEEKDRILTEPFESLWKGLWGDYSNNQYKSEEIQSYEKYRILKNGIKHKDEREYNLQKIVSNSATSWKETEWGFPKGRRNYHEKDVSCALRECLEETGYEIPPSNVIHNIVPYEETYMGSDMKCYKHKYYLAFLDGRHCQMKSHDRMEVSEMKWMSYDECVASMRPYNLEKKHIIKKVHSVLENCKLY